MITVITLGNEVYPHMRRHIYTMKKKRRGEEGEKNPSVPRSLMPVCVFPNSQAYPYRGQTDGDEGVSAIARSCYWYRCTNSADAAVPSDS